MKPGNSSGSILHKNKVACVAYAAQEKFSEVKRGAICISSFQIEPFIERSNNPIKSIKKFCECKNFLLISEAIKKYNKKYKKTLTLHYLKSAQTFLKQASPSSIEAINKPSGEDVFGTLRKDLQKKIKALKKSYAGSNLKKELEPSVCDYF